MNPATRKGRVGVEIEFSGLSVATAAGIVAATFGGEPRARTEYEIEVHRTELGDFRVEVDFALLKRLAQTRADSGEAPGLPEDLLATLARQVAPCEIVTGPIARERIGELDRLAAALRRAGARGTDDALVYAFGVHFNPELPEITVTDVLAHMRAFALLHDWLLVQLGVDVVRRLTPFIRPWPARYLMLILESGYEPDQAGLIDDYLDHNPTRNRALDMLPLFAHLDPRRVAAVVDDPHVKARPTFHYRLSNCRIGDPGWRPSREWRYWLTIESLAAQTQVLAAMSRDYLQLARRPLGDLFAEWPLRTERWLQRL